MVRAGLKEVRRKTKAKREAREMAEVVAAAVVVVSLGGGHTGWFFLTGPPDFQYQNEKTCSANEELFYIENFVKN